MHEELLAVEVRQCISLAARSFRPRRGPAMADAHSAPNRRRIVQNRSRQFPCARLRPNSWAQTVPKREWSSTIVGLRPLEQHQPCPMSFSTPLPALGSLENKMKAKYLLLLWALTLSAAGWLPGQ